jgi:uncharacterized membrane protein
MMVFKSLWNRVSERGQVLVLTAVMLPAVIAGAGLAIDVGLIMQTCNGAAEDVDAMASRRAAVLWHGCSSNPVLADATTWGTSNGEAVDRRRSNTT